MNIEREMYDFRFLHVMPGYSANDNALATKLVEFYPHNTDSPTHQGQVLLFDPVTGNLLAVSTKYTLCLGVYMWHWQI